MIEIAKNIFRLPYSFLPRHLRLGRDYILIKDFLRKSQWWSAEEIKKWQLCKIKEIVNFAYHNTYGYHQLYNDFNIKPSDIQNYDDFKFLPYVTKDLIRDNLNDFTINKLKFNTEYITTGGSTGIPLGFFNSFKERSSIESAFIHHGWERIGWRLNDISIVLRGGYIGTINKIYKYLTTTKQFLFSSYYFNSDTYSIYMNAFLKTKATTLEAYPSQAFELAKLVIENNDINLLKFSFILLGSENLYDWQLVIIRKAFPNSKIYSWYGNAEKNVLAQWTENNDKYYINPFYGYTELLKNDANQYENSTFLEIVGTSFWMKTTPFIRYKTLDLALENKDVKNTNSRNFHVLDKLIGRDQEFIFSNQRKIPISSINMHNNIFDNVYQFQFYQEIIGVVILKIIPKVTFNDFDRNLIHKKVLEKLGNDFKLEILLVKEIQLNKNLKFKFLDQRIKNV